MPEIFDTDVLIVGGGPSGTSAALSLLLHSSLKVILIEQSAFNTGSVGEHVDASLFKLLDYLAIDKERFEEDSFIEGYSNMAAWGNDKITSRNSIHSIEGKSYQLDREKFDLFMVTEVANRGGKIFPRTKCMHFEQLENGHWKILLKHQTKGEFTINARFLIDASGRQSHVCRALDLSPVKHDKLTGIGTFLHFKEDKILPQEVFLETVKYGWWYCAALPGQRMTVTLFTDADIVKEQQLQKPGNWNRLLAETKHIQKRTQNAFSYTVPWVRNAFSQITDVSARDNFLAVGDAAIAFDPISSMGIGFAISSACNAARAVNQSLCGDSSYLKIYQDDITGIFRDYLELRKRYYAAEQRWPESLFWQRRN